MQDSLIFVLCHQKRAFADFTKNKVVCYILNCIIVFKVSTHLIIIDYIVSILANK